MRTIPHCLIIAALAGSATAGCRKGPKLCHVVSCEDQNAQCGQVSDGCGSLLDCGTCSAPQTCGGGGAPNVCGCTPTTCAKLGANCGSPDDGCGGKLACGGCTGHDSCGGGGKTNVCGCTPTTCAKVGATCGNVVDGCGGSLSCGTCAAPLVCGADPAQPNTCVCAPWTCTDLGGTDCGTFHEDACGGTFSCGPCPEVASIFIDCDVGTVEGAPGADGIPDFACTYNGPTPSLVSQGGGITIAVSASGLPPTTNLFDVSLRYIASNNNPLILRAAEVISGPGSGNVLDVGGEVEFVRNAQIPPLPNFSVDVIEVVDGIVGASPPVPPTGVLFKVKFDVLGQPDGGGAQRVPLDVSGAWGTTGPTQITYVDPTTSTAKVLPANVLPGFFCVPGPDCAVGWLPSYELGSAFPLVASGALPSTPTTSDEFFNADPSQGNWDTTSDTPERTYRWTAPASGTYHIDRDSSCPWYSVLYVRKGGCFGELIGSDNPCAMRLGCDAGPAPLSLAVTIDQGESICVIFDGCTPQSFTIH